MCVCGYEDVVGVHSNVLSAQKQDAGIEVYV